MYKIDQEKCTQCGVCIAACGSAAIEKDADGKHVIIPEKCTECGACQAVCEQNAISEE